MAAMTRLSLTLDPMGISHFHLFHFSSPISAENKNPLFDHPMNISAKFGSNLFCGFRKKDEHVKFP
jgi:hypothetical protein